MGLDGADLDVIEIFDPGDRDARTHDLDRAVDRSGVRRKSDQQGLDSFGNGMKPQCGGDDNAKGAFGTDEKPGQIVSGRRFARRT